MALKIHIIRMGLDQCYIIQGKGTIMVDGRAPGKIDEFKRATDKIAMLPGDI